MMMNSGYGRAVPSPELPTRTGEPLPTFRFPRRCMSKKKIQNREAGSPPKKVRAWSTRVMLATESVKQQQKTVTQIANMMLCCCCCCRCAVLQSHRFALNKDVEIAGRYMVQTKLTTYFDSNNPDIK